MLVDLASLGQDGSATSLPATAAPELMAEGQVATHVHRRSSAHTAVALRQRAAGIAVAQLYRLSMRLPDLGFVDRQGVERTVRRVTQRLLHTQTLSLEEQHLSVVVELHSPGGVDQADA